MRYLLCLLFCLMAGVAQAAPAGKAYMSIIIDDLGQSSERDSRTLALPGPVTLAIMPDTPHATTFARQAHKAGKTVILHMPMDPATGPYAWHPGTPLPELAHRLDTALAQVPYAVGINNHMGSRMTAQPEAMAMLMADLQRRHLFFVAAPALPRWLHSRLRPRAWHRYPAMSFWTTYVRSRPSAANCSSGSNWLANKAQPC